VDAIKTEIYHRIYKEKSLFEIFMKYGKPVKVIVMLYYTADRTLGNQADETYEGSASVVFGSPFWN